MLLSKAKATYLPSSKVWVNSGSWWWTGRPGVLRFTGSQRVRHDWATELNWLKDKLRMLLNFCKSVTKVSGLPSWLSGKEPACQCKRDRRWRFSPWVGKIPWRRKWQPIPVFLPGSPVDRGAWLQFMELHRIRHDWVTKHIMHQGAHAIG